MVGEKTEEDLHQAVDCSLIWGKVKQLLCEEKEENVKREARVIQELSDRNSFSSTHKSTTLRLSIESVESFVAHDEIEGSTEASVECDEGLPLSDNGNTAVGETHHDDRDLSHDVNENSCTSILRSYIENQVIDSENINIFGDEFLKTLDDLSEDMIQSLRRFILEGLVDAHMGFPKSTSGLTVKNSSCSKDYKENLKKKITVFFGL